MTTAVLGRLLETATEETSKMAVQKGRKTRSRRDMRRSHDALQGPTLSVDSESGETHRRHHVTADGYYRGKRVIEMPQDVEAEE